MSDSDPCAYPVCPLVHHLVPASIKHRLMVDWGSKKNKNQSIYNEMQNKFPKNELKLKKHHFNMWYVTRFYTNKVMQIQQIEASMQVHRYYAIKSQKKENGL
jgi:hypothetical protein